MTGKWKPNVAKSDDFEPFLAYVGVPWLVRKAVKRAAPVMELNVTDKTFEQITSGSMGKKFVNQGPFGTVRSGEQLCRLVTPRRPRQQPRGRALTPHAKRAQEIDWNSPGGTSRVHLDLTDDGETCPLAEPRRGARRPRQPAIQVQTIPPVVGSTHPHRHNRD